MDILSTQKIWEVRSWKKKRKCKKQKSENKITFLILKETKVRLYSQNPRMQIVIAGISKLKSSGPNLLP